MKVRRVKDPACKGRSCFQYGHSGRVFCGKDARKRALEFGVNLKKEIKNRARQSIDINK